MSLLVLGGDGYVGWPLVCHLATSFAEPLVVVDDGSKRRRVREEGYETALPILTLAQRIQGLREVTGRQDLECVEAGVVDCAEELVRRLRPRAVLHLAQIPSAPYSMKGFAAARETLENNEVGNLAVLFALRDHSPSTHLVKMGSLGEYAPCGVPIAEGYVEAVLDGQPTAGPVPYPRQADDVYHVTKINDTNLVSLACRVWGLAATDVMQSVVYGVQTPFSREHPRLTTRFDCDSTFGSVLHRLVAQALLGGPLTVYGQGQATTGLIALEDSVAALAQWVRSPAASGEHRVINQTTETRRTVLELATLVQRVARSRGIEVELTFEHDPRHESGRPAARGAACNRTLRSAGIPLVPLEEGVERLWEDLWPHRQRLRASGAAPYVDWLSGDLRRRRER